MRVPALLSVHGKLECPVCGYRTHFITCQHVANHGYTTAEFKAKFGLLRLQSDPLRELRASRHRGRKVSAEVREYMSQRRAGKGIGVAGQYKRTVEIREKISRGIGLAHKEGRLIEKGRGAVVHSSKIPLGYAWVRSSWERRAFDVLDGLTNVVRIEVKPFSIPYVFDGVRRQYWPDFCVTFDCGIQEIWEVKADYKLRDPKTMAKLDALNTYVLRNAHLNACVVTSGFLTWLESDRSTLYA